VNDAFLASMTHYESNNGRQAAMLVGPTSTTGKVSGNVLIIAANISDKHAGRPVQDRET
jgi:hypothetical protein